MSARTQEGATGHRAFLRRLSATTLGIISCMIMLHARADPNTPCSQPRDPHPDCGQHNMFVVGEKAVFLSHLPMFHSEHRFQVILEATFRKDGQSLASIYQTDRQSHPGTKMYTLSPGEIFILSTLFSPNALQPLRKAFLGTVYQGHLERGGAQIEGLTGVDINVERVVYARELHPAVSKSATLGYLLFGKEPEFFVAHQITQAPDFDQIVAVKIDGHHFTNEELERGVRVLIPDRENSASHRLKEKETVAAQGHITGAHQFLSLQIHVGVEYYFEEGELLSSPTFAQTPLEKEAGF